MTGLAGGGNKARKLEYLCADAIDQGCDTVVTGGGVQSNHVRMTAAAANRLGLACTIVVPGERPAVPTGNLLLNELLGADIVWAGGPPDLAYEEIEEQIRRAADRLAGDGRRPYAMPIGGASTVGALGYLHAAAELLEQLPEVDVVVVAGGSGGTHAGLAAGLGHHGRVLGVDVGARGDLAEAVSARAAEVAALAGLPAPTGKVRIHESSERPVYGHPTERTREAVLLAARLEGLVLDPVYTGPAMAGVLDACARGEAPPEAVVLFVHTGGLPALFADSYATWLRPA